MIASVKTRTRALLDKANGKVGIPILLYFLGVPGLFVIVIWALFFRGR